MNQPSSLKIDQIVPKWSSILDKIVKKEKDQSMYWSYGEEFVKWFHKQTKLLGEPHMDISNGATCIVGEFWGFGHYESEPLYWNMCSTCERYSYTFMEVFRDICMGEIKDWRENKSIINFLKHVEKKHPERLIMLGELNK